MDRHRQLVAEFFAAGALAVATCLIALALYFLLLGWGYGGGFNGLAGALAYVAVVCCRRSRSTYSAATCGASPILSRTDAPPHGWQSTRSERATSWDNRRPCPFGIPGAERLVNLIRSWQAVHVRR